MATLTGDVVTLNPGDPMLHAVGALVIVKLDGLTVGKGHVAEDMTFSIELSDYMDGELEITLALNNAAPTLAETDGGDLHVMVFYNNVNNFLA